MFKVSWAHLQFSIVTYCAAMAALYLSMRIDLQQPYWSLMTVFIVSQPVAAAVRSKAIQRLLGTLVGACAAVLLVPLLVNSPVLLSLGLALWVGTCLTLSLLDRTPRSYILMLAGYTAVIIGFNNTDHPELIFHLAVARAEEISLGIICATIAHSIWFPRPVGEALRTRLQNWLGEADRWALDILGGGEPEAMSNDRMRLAAAASEIHMMATHLPFDTTHLRATIPVVRALHDRILMLIPILASLSDRLATLREERPELDEGIQRAATQVSGWIEAGSPPAEALSLIADLETMAADTERSSWYALNRIGLFSRLQDLVKTQKEAQALYAFLHDPKAGLSPELNGIIASAKERPLHRDLGLALISGAAAVISILISCLAWVELGWIQGFASATMAGILCCLFATMDDPTPGIKTFGTATALAVFLAGTYLFFVFPAIDSNFPLLMLVLAPPMLTIGVLTFNPRMALLALMTLVNFCNFMAIQERFTADFATFLNNNLSQFFGVFTAIYVTRTIRSMNADASARRILRQTWKSLANLAQGKDSEEPEAITSRMVDRIGLLTPRLAAAKDRKLTGVDALKELRVSMDLVVLQGVRNELPGRTQAVLDRLLTAVGNHYAARSAGTPTNDNQLLPILDHALSMLSVTPPVRGARGLAALVGLRRNLFPQAKFAPESVGGAAL